MCNNQGPMFISPKSFVSSRPAEKSIGSLVIGYVIKNLCQNVCNVVWIYDVTKKLAHRTHSTPHTKLIGLNWQFADQQGIFCRPIPVTLWLPSSHWVQTQFACEHSGCGVHFAMHGLKVWLHSFTIWVMKCVQHSCFMWIKVHQFCFNLCWWCTKGRLPTVCCRRLIQPVKCYKVSPRT
jgi:hypothetical protein